MIKCFKRKYYNFRIGIAQDDIDLIMGIHNASEDELKNNVSYIIANAKLNYYKALLSVVYY